MNTPDKEIVEEELLAPNEEVEFTDEEQREFELMLENTKRIEAEKKFMETRVTTGFTITSGFFSKSSTRQFLASQKFLRKADINITWQETDGFSCLFCVEVNGPRYKVREWCDDVKRCLEYGC